MQILSLLYHIMRVVADLRREFLIRQIKMDNGLTKSIWFYLNLLKVAFTTLKMAFRPRKRHL